MKMIRINTALSILLTACALLSGCSTPYMQNRSNDLKDVFDIGLTVNGGKPQFRLDFEPFVFPIGYSDLNCKLIGLGNRKFGINDFESKGWGALLTGEGVYGTGPFDPSDPRQYRPSDKPEDAPEDRPSYDLGLIPLANDGNTLWTKNVECNKGIHLGWIGIHLPCRPLDLVDFVLGLAGMDIMHDDVVKPAEEQAEPIAVEM